MLKEELVKYAKTKMHTLKVIINNVETDVVFRIDDSVEGFKVVYTLDSNVSGHISGVKIYDDTDELMIEYPEDMVKSASQTDSYYSEVNINILQEVL